MTPFLPQFQLEENKKFDKLPIFSAPVKNDVDGVYTFVAEISIVKEFLNASHSRLIDKIVEMLQEVISKKEQIHGFQPYSIDTFLNDDGEGIFFEGFDDGRNMLKIDLMDLISKLKQI
jgi:hypothetical protein